MFEKLISITLITTITLSLSSCSLVSNEPEDLETSPLSPTVTSIPVEIKNIEGLSTEFINQLQFSKEGVYSELNKVDYRKIIRNSETRITTDFEIDLENGNYKKTVDERSGFGSITHMTEELKDGMIIQWEGDEQIGEEEVEEEELVNLKIPITPDSLYILLNKLLEQTAILETREELRSDEGPMFKYIFSAEVDVETDRVSVIFDKAGYIRETGFINDDYEEYYYFTEFE